MSRAILATSALALAALVGTGSANAADVRFSGYANGSESVYVSLSGGNWFDVDAGGFKTTLNGGSSFTAYCIDLTQTIDFNTTYNEYVQVAGTAHTFANTKAANDIGRLFSEKHVINDSESQAAMQIAIWEIAYETSGAYNLGTGSARFALGSAWTSGALSLASSWLSTLPATSTYMVSTLDSNRHQDMVIAAPVPEPSTYMMLAGGLMCIGLLAARRTPRG